MASEAATTKMEEPEATSEASSIKMEGAVSEATKTKIENHKQRARP